MSEPQLQEPPAVSLSLQEKHEQALKECDRLLDHFKTRAERNKHLFNGLKYSSIILTIGVTVLAALPANPIPWSVPVVAGLAALCTTLLSATHAQELWVLSRSTQKYLMVERFHYCQGVGSYAELRDEDKVRRFSERVIEIWSGGHDAWQQNVAEKQLGGHREQNGPEESPKEGRKTGN